MMTTPFFLTNAHVVKNADIVQVQLPALGQERFEAYVPLICSTFDLAAVRLTKPEKLRAALEAKKAMLRPLDVRREPLSLGLEVAAVGFPLGTNSLKVSRGIISGTERVQRMTSYQSTAPISPGNSGGPLFSTGSGNLQLIGLTIMKLTMNHLDSLIRKGQYSLGRWLCPENALQPRLAVVHVDPGTYAARVLRPGMIIKSVNGHDVFQLEDFRKFFTPSLGNSSADAAAAAVPWQLMTDRNITFAVNYTDALLKQLLKIRMGRCSLTETIANATKAAGLFKGASSGQHPFVLRHLSQGAGHNSHGVRTLSQKLGDPSQAVEVRIAHSHAQAASRAQFAQPGSGI